MIICSISALIRYIPVPLGFAISSVIMFSALMFVQKEFLGILCLSTMLKSISIAEHASKALTKNGFVSLGLSAYWS
jgi:hypothetical protein